MSLPQLCRIHFPEASPPLASHDRDGDEDALSLPFPPILCSAAGWRMCAGRRSRFPFLALSQPTQVKPNSREPTAAAARRNKRNGFHKIMFFKGMKLPFLMLQRTRAARCGPWAKARLGVWLVALVRPDGRAGNQGKENLMSQPAHKIRISNLSVTIWRNPATKAPGTPSTRAAATRRATKPGRKPTASASTT